MLGYLSFRGVGLRHGQAYLLAQTRRAFGRVSAPPLQVTLLSFDIAGNAKIKTSRARRNGLAGA
jgi:hypothetical protein